MDKFRVFVYMLMRDASLKQRIPCIMRISIFGAFSAGKKCALYTGKYGTSAKMTKKKPRFGALPTLTMPKKSHETEKPVPRPAQ